MSTFPGFSPKALTFFRQLARNNDRDWFAANKKTYAEFVETPMLELVGVIGEALRSVAGEYVREPKKHLYRIYRDTRFSKDKTPYKTHLGAQYQHPQVTKNLGAGFYFHVSAKELCIAGGIYMPGPEELAALRAAFRENPTPFRKVIAEKSLVKLMGKPTSQSSVKVPKGFDADDPAADLLKLKQFYYSVDLDPKLALTPKVTGEIVRRFKVLAPLIHYLNNTIVAAARSQAGEASSIPSRPKPMF
jgi:uncharacterized protein (TIGR02453 family)